QTTLESAIARGANESQAALAPSVTIVKRLARGVNTPVGSVVMSALVVSRASAAGIDLCCGVY
ncbi:MAG TPA: hypothetical protein VEJ39_06035, partial [Candidatus Acidoferrales bacterium]|nr:hypothetical protein [Candidatus Acidoferrales bacterium]